VLGEPAQRRDRLVDRRRERVLGRQPVADAHHERARGRRERPRDAVERGDRADRPAATVQVGDDRQAGVAGGRIGTQRDPAVRTGDREVADACEPRPGTGELGRLAVVRGAQFGDGWDVGGEQHSR
jgi:hypothetical protein